MRVVADLVVNHTSDRASVVPGRARDRDSPFRDFYVWRTTSRAEEPGDVVVPRPGELQLGLRPQGAASTTCTASTASSPTSTSPTPRCATRSPRSPASGCSRAWPASASTPCRSCSSRSGCRRARMQDPHELLRDLRALHRPPARRRDAARRGQPAARPAARVLRRRGRRRAAHGVQLPVNQAMCLALARGEADAARARRSTRAARDPARLASGRPSCATTTSSRSTSSPTTERDEVFAALRARRADAALRARAAAAAAADARRRRAPACGWRAA